MFRRRICLILFLGFFPWSVSTAQVPPASNICPPAGGVRERAPSPLPHVQPAFENAVFWTARQAEPDKILLDRQEIEKINRSGLQSDPEAVDIFSLADGMDSAFLRKILTADRQRHGKQTFYDYTNRPLSPDDLARIFSRMNIEGIPAVLKPRHGLITRETNLRVFPTDDLVMDRPFDHVFDRFQADRLEGGTAVAVLHYTVDRSWCFVETGGARGWVRPGDVAIGTREDVMRFTAAKPLVVTGDAVPFYRDRELEQFVFNLPMGARLPFAGRYGDVYKVHLPWRSPDGSLVLAEGFVRCSADVHEGCLAYSFGAVLRQAFKLQNRIYSWGGLNGGRDCSRFILEVFRCFGFRMPRDSYRQAAFAGDHRVDVAKRTDADKMDLLERSQQVPTLLYMKGHVMLLLGVVDGRAYAIHSYWDYGLQDRPGILYHVGRVAVTDLSLGKDGEGNLLNWITALIPLR
jgi:hypothetical protein